MPTKFRNLQIDGSASISEWGVEGMLTVIERGSLSDWQRIAAEVSLYPHGEIANELAEALVVSEGWGTNLLRRVLEDARSGGKAVVARRMRHSVRRSGLSLREFARILGTSHSRLSTYLSGQVAPSAAIAVRAAQIGELYRQ